MGWEPLRTLEETSSRTRRAGAVAAGALLSAALVAGYAASLGGVNVQQLAGYTVVTSPEVVFASSSFTGPSNTNLHGYPTDTGQLWTVHAGSWRIAGNAANQLSSTPRARVTVETGEYDVAVQVTMKLAVPYDAGVVFRANATGSSYLAVTISRGGMLTLKKYVAPGYTTLATTRVPVGSSTTVRVEAVGADITVYVDGVLVLSYTLSAADCALFCTNTRHGLISEGDRVSRFDNFLVAAP